MKLAEVFSVSDRSLVTNSSLLRWAQDKRPIEPLIVTMDSIHALLSIYRRNGERFIP